MKAEDVKMGGAFAHPKLGVCYRILTPEGRSADWERDGTKVICCIAADNPQYLSWVLAEDKVVV